MNVLVPLIAGVAIFGIASRFYARRVARVLGVDPERKTPACEINDGRDYVPTRLPVLFAHHFSAIAGAGPILGPTMALIYGTTPGLFWVILGGIFIGAVHDFTSLFVCLREKGRSMAEVARSSIGNAGFVLYILFTIVLIVLVTSSFLTATATSLTSMWPVDKLGLSSGQTLLRVVEKDGVQLGVIGGIASTSVVIITLFSPFLGYLIYKKNFPTYPAYLIAAVVSVLSVVAGVHFPVTFKPEIWMIIISIYCLFAAGVPVWVILQPRDFINVQILYIGLLGLFAGIVVGGFHGLTLKTPALNVAEGVRSLGFLWPMLFITIACGAISGFHAMVAGGTTSKQISSEAHAKRIGYDGMLLESMLALLVILAIGSSLDFSDYKSIVWQPAPGAKSNPILAFSLAIGHLFNNTFSIPVPIGTIFGILLLEGFVITTLDAAVRLNRYLFEELWNIVFRGNTPGFLRNYWVNSGISVLLMWILAYSNAFSALWPIFGTGNQMLAALSLIAVSMWLLLRGRRVVYTFVPAIFMIATTIASLIILMKKYITSGNKTLIVADFFLLLFSAGVILVAIQAYLKVRNGELQKVADLTQPADR
jgi:carbon starvation protein